MRYLRKFNQHLDYLTYTSNANKNKPIVSYCKREKDSHYDSEKYYQKQYFTIVPLTNGYISYNTTGTVSMTSLYYQYEGSKEWISLFTSSSNVRHFYIPVVANQRVKFKGTGTRTSGTADARYSYFYLQKYNNFDSENDEDYELPFEVEGNIMTLIVGDSIWTDIENISFSNRTFAALFSDSGVTNAKNLILDSILFKGGMLTYTFSYMFKNCQKLVCPPKFYMDKNTEINNYVFRGMFQGCSSLVVAPELPVVDVNYNYPYTDMFADCTSLTTAPKLPATILGKGCYAGMFQGCTSLTTAPELPATTLAQECYCEMFKGCTSLIKAPELIAQTLVKYCYESMFEDCTNLNYVKAWFTGWEYIEDSVGESNTSDYTMKWLKGVSQTGTFVMNKIASWNPEETVTLDLYDETTHETTSQVTVYKYRNYYWNEVCYQESYIPSNWSIQKEVNIPQRYRNNPYYSQYLTFESLEDDNNIYFAHYFSSVNIQYSIDNGSTWISYNSQSRVATPAMVTLNTGDKLLLKGSNSRYGYSSDGASNAVFSSSKTLNVYGNIMSLVQLDNFVGGDLYNSSSNLFISLFNEGPDKLLQVVSAENLILPLVTLSRYCYYGMFEFITTLTRMPELPAQNLNQYSCQYMFRNCTSLTSTTKIEATHFEGLGACSNMFIGCTALTYVPDFPEATFALVSGASYAYINMFKGCTSLQTAPVLPSQDLTGAPYRGMFNDCTSLNYVKCLATTLYTNTTSSNNSWLDNVSSTGTFVKKSGVDWSSSLFTIPEGWTVLEETVS